MSDRDNSILSPELVRRAQAGDEAAFNELYQRTGAMIYRTILSMVRDEDTAWDIHQNSYILAYRSLKKLENPEAFLNWLRRIAVNEAIKATTKEQPLRFSELADEDGELPQFEETRDSYQPELEMDRQEAARLVREILKKLPERQQLIVGMYYYESYSIREIAEALNITQGTVKTQLHLGRKRVEAEVRRLEAEGIKLYGMSPMAFLVFLLRNQKPARQIGKKAAQAVVTKALSGQPVVLTAKTAGTGFFHTALGKLTAVALSAAVVAGGVLGYQALQDKLEARMGDYRPTQTLVSTEPAPALTEAGIDYSADERGATEPVAQTESQPTLPTEHRDPVSGRCGENLSWTFYPDSGLLAIEGSGAMEDYQASVADSVSDYDRPWSSFQDEIVTISFPEELTYIGTDAFLQCSGLKTGLSLPEGLQAIGKSAFQGCEGLSEVSFPQSLRSVGDSAFAYTGLSSLTLPEGLTYIGQAAFTGCSLTGLTLPEGLTCIGEDAFRGCSLTSVTLPSSLVTIEAGAFAACDLTSVTLPQGLTDIGERAFQDCKALTNVTLPQGLTDIGERAFQNCKALTNVKLPASVEKIGEYAFQGCDAMQAIDVDENNPVYGSLDGVLYSHYNEKLRNSVLVFCPAGKTGAFAMEDTVYEVGVCAFEGCKGLTEIRFSENLSSIGGSAFSGCSGLTSLTLPAALEGIGPGAFEDCTGLTELSLPELKSLPSSTFRGCTGLRSITLPDSIRWIEAFAFSGCSSLSDVRLPESLTTIGHCAFRDCVSLTQITIPDGVNVLETNAFKGCSALESFRLTDGNDSFCSVDGVLYDKEQRVLIKYPEGKKNDTLTISADITCLEDIELNCQYLTEINVESGNQWYSSLDGVLFDADQTELIRVPCRKQGVYEIPQSVDLIDLFGFQNCAELSALIIPANVSFDMSKAYDVSKMFTGCVSLEEIRVAEDNEDYSSQDGMLLNKAQTELLCCPPGKTGACTIPASVRSLEYGAFFNCANLTSVTIPAGVRDISGAFSDSQVWKDFIIYGVPDSEAQHVAEEYGFRFVPIDG